MRHLLFLFLVLWSFPVWASTQLDSDDNGVIDAEYLLLIQSDCSGETETGIFCLDSDDGKLYYYDGDSVEEVGTGSGGTPGGSDTQLQYNNSGSFGGIADLYYSGGLLYFADDFFPCIGDDCDFYYGFNSATGYLDIISNSSSDTYINAHNSGAGNSVLVVDQISTAGIPDFERTPDLLNDSDGITGSHDGSNNAATLSDSGASFVTDALIGLVINNTTDGSSCTITDNDTTTITCTLSGGTDDDWDTDDAYTVPGYVELTTAELKKTKINNFETSPIDRRYAMPVANTGWNAEFVCGSNGYDIAVDPNGSEQYNLDDVQLSAGQAIEVSSCNKGDRIVLDSVKTGSSTWEVYVYIVKGSWAGE